MIRNLVAACLAALALALCCAPAHATETAQITFSGTYAPIVQPYYAVPTASGGPFSSSLDYDSSRSAPDPFTSSFTSDFYTYSGNDTTNDALPAGPNFTKTQPYINGYTPLPCCRRGLLQVNGSTNRVSAGVYQMVFFYPVGSYFSVNLAGRPWCPNLNSKCFAGYGRPAIFLGYTVNLGSDAAGYYDLSKITMTPTAFNSICPYFPVQDAGTSAIMIRTIASSTDPTGGATEVYKLSGTPTLSGTFYINTTNHSRNNTPPDPCGADMWSPFALH